LPLVSNGVTTKRKTVVTLLILSLAVLLLIFFVLNPTLGRVRKESQNLIAQKNKIFESETKIKNLQHFKDNSSQYQPNLEKISQLFINISEPIGFIEFLEGEALDSQLSIEIAPLILRKAAEGSWPALEFNLDMKGSFPNFLRFLNRLESGPYLIEATNLSVRKNPEIKENIIAILSVRVYAK